MLLYYALGGGYGHITRAMSVIHTLGIKEEVLLLTSLEHTLEDTPFKILPSNVIPLDCPHYDFSQKLKLQAFIQDIIEHHDVSQAFVDTFPMGIFGELDFLQEHIPLTHIARILKWQNYTKYITATQHRFQTTYVIETLHSDHLHWLNRHSDHVFPLPLTHMKYSHEKVAQALSQALRREISESWLVVHSGPRHEIHELLLFVKEVQEIENARPPIVLICPGEYETTPELAKLDISQCNLYPAYPLFPLAKRIFTGCGFNVMSELKTCSKKHHFIPFDRVFDDQHFRAANYNKQYRNSKKTHKPETA
ncbi:MAG: hypothetical protein OEZ68_14425 [Gammaproteobacteria bacterium]|nr:hypothetical protein [Gammaproteobacteria bacterium]MDH5801999.1 hypothetical protein [Gammaproteobacteria bacterium]